MAMKMSSIANSAVAGAETQQNSVTELLAFWVAAGDLKNNTVNKITMLAYLFEDDSDDGKLFASLIDELLKVPPRSHRRVKDYLNQLNSNLAEDRRADPREYAKKVMRNGDDAS